MNTTDIPMDRDEAFAEWWDGYQCYDKKEDALKDAFRAGTEFAHAWHDIASAPKDGAEVLLWGNLGNTNFPSGTERLEVFVGYFNKDGYPEDWVRWDCEAVNPTHWMPLPKPPEAP